MIQIIPAILEKKFSAIAEKIKRLEQEAPQIELVQLDIMDGAFVPNTTWSAFSDLAKLKTRLLFEIHLMVKKPARYIQEVACEKQIKRVLIHRESVESDEECAELILQIKENGQEAGIAVNPKTEFSKIEKLLDIADVIMVMGVTPGFSGQQFQKSALAMIKLARAANPTIPISVDGGVNADTAPAILAAGATRLCVASYLWNSKNISKAISSLTLTVIGK